jgi:hypothetical protein
MEIPKPAEADKSRFTALVPADPRVEIKPMFGNLGAFVNGNMFMGVFGPSIGMKLPETDCDTLRLRGATPFGPVERPMGGYVSLPTNDECRRGEDVGRKGTRLRGFHAGEEGEAEEELTTPPRLSLRAVSARLDWLHDV